MKTRKNNQQKRKQMENSKKMNNKKKTINNKDKEKLDEHIGGASSGPELVDCS